MFSTFLSILLYLVKKYLLFSLKFSYNFKSIFSIWWAMSAYMICPQRCDQWRRKVLSKIVMNIATAWYFLTKWLYLKTFFFPSTKCSFFIYLPRVLYEFILVRMWFVLLRDVDKTFLCECILLLKHIAGNVLSTDVTDFVALVHNRLMNAKWHKKFQVSAVAAQADANADRHRY